MPIQKLAPIVNTPGTTPIDKVTKIAREIEEWALKRGYVITLFYGSTTWPDHSNRRCLDIMTASAKDAKTGQRLTPAQSIRFGDTLRSYISSQAKRFGANGVIWNRGVWGFPHVKDNPPYRGPYNSRRKYTGPNPHVDHNHLEVDNAPYRPPGPIPPHPSWYYPKPKDNVVYRVKLDPGMKDSDSVYWMQLALNHVLDGEDLKLTGDYDPPTKEAARRFQVMMKNDAKFQDGDLGPNDIAALFDRAKMKMTILDRP